MNYSLNFQLRVMLSVFPLLNWYISACYNACRLYVRTRNGIPVQLCGSTVVKSLIVTNHGCSSDNSLWLRNLWSQIQTIWLLVWWSLEVYMVVNFRTHKISQGMRKLARTPMLIKKRACLLLYFKKEIFLKKILCFK